MYRYAIRRVSSSAYWRNSTLHDESAVAAAIECRPNSLRKSAPAQDEFDKHNTTLHLLLKSQPYAYIPGTWYRILSKPKELPLFSYVLLLFCCFNKILPSMLYYEFVFFLSRKASKK